MVRKTDDKSSESKSNFTHFTKEQREEILKLLQNGNLQKEIADKLSVSKTSISREIFRNRTFVKNRSLRKNFCTKVQECKIKNLCQNMNCQGLCKNCKYEKLCNTICKEYIPMTCKRLIRFPYVCDGCPKAGACTLDHFHYYPNEADKYATERLVQTRRGISITEEQLAAIDTEIVNGCEKNQSLEHIFSVTPAPVTTRTIRNYINNGILTTSKSELPRGTICKPRNVKITKTEQQKIRKAKQGRDFPSFLKYADSQPFLSFSELDTVEGSSSQGDKARLMTLIVVRTHLFLCYRIPDGTQESIETAFNNLYAALGHEDFVFLFGCILTDNGKEFSRPENIETDKITGLQRSRVFYCHPYSSWEKGAVEVCHELLRRIIPKGMSLEKITPQKARLICSHINSYYRPESEGCSYDVFVNAFGDRAVSILKKLGIEKINSKDVNLSPSLLMD